MKVVKLMIGFASVGLLDVLIITNPSSELMG